MELLYALFMRSELKCLYEEDPKPISRSPRTDRYRLLATIQRLSRTRFPEIEIRDFAFECFGVRELRLLTVEQLSHLVNSSLDHIETKLKEEKEKS